MKQLFSFLLYLLFFNLVGQSVVHQTYNTNHGLPSSEVYCVVQDKQGYIYIGTDNGIAKFNGNEFISITTTDGLPDNTVIDLILDDDSLTIWPVTLSSDRLCFMKKGILFPYYQAPKPVFHAGYQFRGRTLTGKPIIREAGVDKILNSENQLKTVLKRHEGKCRAVYFWNQLKDNSAYLESNTETKSDSFKLIKKGAELVLVYPYSLLKNATLRESIKLSNGKSMVYFSDGTYVVFDSNKVLESGKFVIEGVTGVKQDFSTSIWILTNNGAYKFNGGNLQSIPHKFLDGHYITDMIQGLDGNYWFTDHNKGLIKISSLNMNQYQWGLDSKKPIAQLSLSSSSLLFSTIDGELCELNKKGEVKKLTKDNGTPYDFYPFYVLNSKQIILPGAMLNANKLKQSRYMHVKSGFKTFAAFEEKIYAGSSHGIIELNKEGDVIWTTMSKRNKQWGLQNTEVNNFSVRCNALLSFHGELWIGSANGLYKSAHPITQTPEYLGDLHSELKIRVNVVKKWKENKLLIGTKGGGLLIYDVKTNKLNQININNGLVSDIVKSIAVLENVVCVGTNLGLNIVSLSNEGALQKIKLLNVEEGLPSNEIRDITLFNHKIMIATSLGLVSVSDKVLKFRQKEIKLQYHLIQTKDSIYNFYQEVIQLRKEERDVKIKFESMSFNDHSKISYKYVIENFSKDTFYTNKTEIELTNLLPKNYVVKIWAQNQDGYWNTHSVEMKFCIPKKWFETWWFYALCGLVFIGTIVIITRAVYKYKNNETAHELQVTELKQKALTALMNPHFIYNSLTAIQNFINQGDNKKSNIYLSKFSRLIRMNLNTTKDGSVLLEEELERLKIYLEVEQMRFGEKLVFEIKVNSDVDTDDLLIPAMILQPFVENAIWHGILPKESNGSIQINITKISKGAVHIDILDDGVGLSALKANDSHHTSISTEVTKERLALLSKKSGIDHSIQIYANPNLKNGEGTLVSLKIPILG